jgi:heme/copper-type cytochrome/quinol oxidase subunit 2
MKPENGYLIVASNTGYNDSASKGNASWPIITVNKGTTVNIVVCNTDTQTHGFQISNYLTSPTESISPGKVFRISFVANEVGTFRIYEGISSSTSSFMQNGELVVTS